MQANTTVPGGDIAQETSTDRRAPRIEDLGGVWQRTLLIEPDGKVDRTSEVYWLQLGTLCGRALQLRRSFVALDRRNATFQEACDRLAAGIVGIDGSGRTIIANAAAAQMSAREDGLGLDRQGRPYAIDRAANQRLAELARDVVDGGSGGIVRVPRPRGSPPYVVIVAPLMLEMGVSPRGGGRRGTLFVIHDPLTRPRRR